MKLLPILFICFSTAGYTQQNNYAYTDSLPNYPVENELEYQIKYYLAEKYTPGSCYGMPSPRKYDLDKITNYDVYATSYIKSILTIQPDSPANERKIAIQIQQFLKIKLVKTETGFNFHFTDGNCCRITTVKGKVYIDHNEIKEEIMEKVVKRVPC